jgi:hypothetical protein
MVRRYAHLSSDHLAEYVDGLSDRLRLVGENPIGVVSQEYCESIGLQLIAESGVADGTRTHDNRNHNYTDRYQPSLECMDRIIDSIGESPAYVA